MLRIHRSLLASIIVRGALAWMATLAGCATHNVILAAEPPPPRHERVVYRPGYLWVHGHWVRSGTTWHWRDGYYARERPGYVYIEGRWHHGDGGPLWIEGGWRRRGSRVVIREQR